MNELCKKSEVELEECINRQRSLLLKKAFIAKLPDKGSKLRETLLQLEKELNDRRCRDVGKHAAMGQVAALERLEWTGEYAREEDRQADSDDESSGDETDPLKILATQTGAGMYKKQYRFKKAVTPPSLIRPEDVPVDAYASRLCSRDETAAAANSTKRPSFKPYKTVIPHQAVSPEHERARLVNPHWEVTAATPPAYQHGDTKPVGLAESLALQTDHQQRLKELQASQAADRLASQIKRMHMAERAASTSTPDLLHADLEEEGEVDEEEERGGVVYSVADDDVS